MPRKHIFKEGYAYFITTNVRNNHLVFRDDKCCDLLIKDFNYYRKDLGFLIYGYVIMPTHFHWFKHPRENATVPLIMQKIKGLSGYVINKYLKQKGSLWQENYYDHGIRNERDFREKMNYIHKNPVEDDLVENMADYKYSSYRNYYFDDHRVMQIDVPIL